MGSIGASASADPLSALKAAFHQVFQLVEKERVELKRRNDTLERPLDILARYTLPLEEEKRRVMKEIFRVVGRDNLLKRPRH